MIDDELYCACIMLMVPGSRENRLFDDEYVLLDDCMEDEGVIGHELFFAVENSLFCVIFME